MPFVNQGDDCETRGSWHQSTMIGSFRDRPFKTPVFSSNTFQQPFHSSSYFHESSASQPSAFSQYYGAYYDSKNGGLPDSQNHMPFRHSQIKSARTRIVSERQNVEPAIARPRIGSFRRDYDIDDVFCPSYVDRDAAKLRQQNNFSTNIASGEAIATLKPTEKNDGPAPKPLHDEPHMNSEPTNSDNCYISDIKSTDEDDACKVITYSAYVDMEAERALLLSMGWQETPDEEFDGDISQQEIEEFYRLLRNSRSSSQPGRFSSSRLRHTSDQTSSTPGLSTGSTPAQPEVFDDKCLSDDGLSSDDSLSVEDD